MYNEYVHDLNNMMAMSMVNHKKMLIYSFKICYNFSRNPLPLILKTDITSFKSMKSKKHGFNVSPSKVPSNRKC